MAKGLFDCYTNEQQPRKPDGEPEWANKGLLSCHTYLLKKRRAEKQLFAEAQKGKAACQRKATQLKKDTYSRLLGFLLQKERMKLM
jgi:hypothetical protein